MCQNIFSSKFTLPYICGSHRSLSANSGLLGHDALLPVDLRRLERNKCLNLQVPINSWTVWPLKWRYMSLQEVPCCVIS
jgi:hypothetical protein